MASQRTCGLAAALLACLIAAGPGCASSEVKPAAPEVRHDGSRRPAGLRPGAFSWRDVRGAHDRMEAFRDLRDRAIAVVEDAARFPGEGGADSPALREIPAIRAAFDETHLPEQLDARVVYFDRERRPPEGRDEVPAEGVEVRLLRVDPRGPARTLTLTLEDVAADGLVDGQVDRIAVRWAPADLAIDLDGAGGQLVARVRMAGGPEYRVTSPHLGALLARAQSEVYKPLGGPAFTRAVREGSAPLMIRPSPPRNTSFTPSIIEASERR